MLKIKVEKNKLESKYKNCEIYKEYINDVGFNSGGILVEDVYNNIIEGIMYLTHLLDNIKSSKINTNLIYSSLVYFSTMSYCEDIKINLSVSKLKVDLNDVGMLKDLGEIMYKLIKISGLDILSYMDSETEYDMDDIIDALYNYGYYMDILKPIGGGVDTYSMCALSLDECKEIIEQL